MFTTEVTGTAHAAVSAAMVSAAMVSAALVSAATAAAVVVSVCAKHRPVIDCKSSSAATDAVLSKIFFITNTFLIVLSL